MCGPELEMPLGQTAPHMCGLESFGLLQLSGDDNLMDLRPHYQQSGAAMMRFVRMNRGRFVTHMVPPTQHGEKKYNISPQVG